MKVTAREKFLLWFAVIFLSAVIFYNLFFEPLMKEINTLKENIAEKQMIYDSLSTQEDGLDLVSKELRASERSLDEVEQMFPTEWDDAYILSLIESVIGDLAEKNSLTYTPVQKKGDYYEGVYVISLKGSYDNICEILDRFEKIRYFNTVSDFNITKESVERDIESTITLHFYSLEN